MKKCMLFTAASLLLFSTAQADKVEIVGDYRVSCHTSFPSSGRGIGYMTKILIEDQIESGHKNIVSVTSTKVGSNEIIKDNSTVAVCVTAKK